MKKWILIYLFLFGIYILSYSVKAYSITYSEWSEIYPNGIEKKYIEEEERYRFYKDVETNVEYLVKDDFGQKMYDLNDYKYTEESDKSTIKPEEKDDRIISSYSVNYSFTGNKIGHILINNINEILFSEIEIYNKNNEKIVINIADEKYNFLIDGDNENFKEVENNSEILIKLDKEYIVNQLYISINYKATDNSSLKLNFIENDLVYGSRVFDLSKCSNECELKTDSYDGFKYNKFINLIYYSYKDKIYKTYDLVREYLDGYHLNMDGFIKDESQKKIYYRYITNKYVLIDSSNNVVLSEEYCNKNFCVAVLVDNNPVNDEEIVNPQTSDNVEIYFIIGIISITILLIIILFHKKYKRKCRTNKSSNFVEVKQIK